MSAPGCAARLMRARARMRAGSPARLGSRAARWVTCTHASVAPRAGSPHARPAPALPAERRRRARRRGGYRLAVMLVVIAAVGGAGRGRDLERDGLEPPAGGRGAPRRPVRRTPSRSGTSQAESEAGFRRTTPAADTEAHQPGARLHRLHQGRDPRHRVVAPDVRRRPEPVHSLRSWSVLDGCTCRRRSSSSDSS